MQDSKSHNSSESFPDVSVDYVWNACAVALTAGEGFPTRTSACCSVCHSSPGVTGSGGHVKAEADRRVDVASADLSLPQKRLCASPRALAKWSLLLPYTEEKSLFHIIFPCPLLYHDARFS